MFINNALILDTETHALKGLPIEIAYSIVSFENGAFVFDKNNTFNQLYSIGDKRIDIGAMATHNIIDSDLNGMPHFSNFRLPEGTEYLIGHNIDYDIQTIAHCGEQPAVKAICTLAMSRKAFPELDTHKLGAMIYYVLKHETARNLLQNAHRADADVYMTAILANKLTKHYGITNMDDFYAFSEECRIPDRINFGKHKGELLKDLPASYVKWLLKEENLDPYLRTALINL